MWNDPHIGTIDGDSWEKICHISLKQRYAEDYLEIPGSDGDYGLDGLIKDLGKVYQCYCPEKEYTDKDLYVHLRDKIHRDVAKLKTNEKEIKSLLGDNKICRWLLITPPKVPDKRLLEYIVTKTNEVLNWNLEIVDDSFEIKVLDLEYLIPEISTAIQSYGSINSSLTLGSGWAYPATGISDQEIADFKEEAEKIPLVQKAHRKHSIKLSHLTTGVDKERRVHEAVDRSIRVYLMGEGIKKEWEKQFPDQLEVFYRLKSALELKVQQLCDAPLVPGTDRFQEILNLVESKIDESFKSLSIDTRMNISQHVVAEWLINCPLNFE